jgi:hypothetical protein
MPAKFVNLFYFWECKIFLELKVEILFVGGGYPDGVITGVDVVDMAPKEEPAFGETGYADADVVQGEQFLVTEAAFTVKEVGVANAKGQVYNGCGPSTRQEHDQADAKEEDDLYQPEKKIDPGHQEKLSACQHQDKDIKGDKELTPKIYAGQFLPVDMAKGMGQDKYGGNGV